MLDSNVFGRGQTFVLGPFYRKTVARLWNFLTAMSENDNLKIRNRNRNKNNFVATVAWIVRSLSNDLGVAIYRRRGDGEILQLSGSASPSAQPSIEWHVMLFWGKTQVKFYCLSSPFEELMPPFLEAEDSLKKSATIISETILSSLLRVLANVYKTRLREH